MADMALSPPDFDAEALIAAVAARPPLWQSKHKDHKNRWRKGMLWAQVAAAVVPGVVDGAEKMQKKWKSLRDKYRRLLNVVLDAGRSGAGAEDQPVITWCFFEQLSFLKDTMEGRPTSGNMTKTAPTPQAALSPEAAVPPHAAAPSGTPHDILEGIANYEDLDSVSLSNEDISLEDHLSEGAGVSPVSTASLGGAPPSRSAPRSSVPSSCSGSTQSRPSKKRKEMDDPLYAHINDISQKMATWKPLDSDEHFALSLVNYMQKVKEQEKLEMRMKVLEVIKDYTN